MAEKPCSKCKTIQPLDCFYSDKRAKDGKQSSCKSCFSEYQTSEKRRTAKRKSYSPEKRQEEYEKYRDAALAQSRKNYQKNKDAILERGKLHYLKNKSLYASYVRKRQAQKKNAFLDCLSATQVDEIKHFYSLAEDLKAVTGEEYHVDHIWPLNGKDSCGLHVPWNLQILPSDINLAKSNKRPDKLK